jgi:uncharacterized membrane protein required for colicin V production
VNLFDLGVAISLAIAVITGWKRGVVEPVARWVGMAGAVLIAIRNPDVMTALWDRVGLERSGSAVVITILIFAVLGALLGSVVGQGALRAAPVPGLKSADQAFGALVGAAGVVFVVWIIAPVAGLLPGAWAQMVRDGRTTAIAEERLPAPPDLFAPVRAIAGELGGRPAPVRAGGVQIPGVTIPELTVPS